LAYPEAYAEPVRRYSLRGVVVALTLVLPVMALVELATAWHYLNRTPAFSISGDEFGFMITVGSLATDPLSAAHLVLFLLIFVLFVVWQYRHAKNAQRLGQRYGLGPGWAIGGWFIPLANFVLPAMQIFQASKPSFRDRWGPRGAGIVIWWAVVFAISTVRLSMIGPTPGYAQFADTFTAGTRLLSVLAAVLCIVMVRSLSRRQDAAMGEMESAMHMPSAPLPSASPPPAHHHDLRRAPRHRRR
jgi:Ca2+/Na+ antiporter